jgi:PAS domain S-box-containing protein
MHSRTATDQGVPRFTEPQTAALAPDDRRIESESAEVRRVQAEEALAESEARYRALFVNNCMPMLLINPDNARIVDANLQAVAYYGRDKATLTAMHVMDINTQTPEQIRAEMALAASSRKTHFDFKHRLASGEVRDVEVFSSLVNFNGETFLLSTIHDVTERQREQTQMKSMQRLLQRFIDEFPGTIYVKDDQLRLLMVNQQLVQTLGVPSDDLIGKTAYDIFPKEFADVVTELDKQMLAEGGRRTVEETFNGRHLETHMFVIDNDAGERLLAGLSLDETERYQAAALTSVLLQLNELGDLLPEKDFLTRGLEMAEKLTGSEIGFLHFVNDDQETLELVTWTAGALRGCTVAYDAHYPVSQAGIWVSCVREKRPVIFNDYATYSAKCGLPAGHAELVRLISVPVVEGDQVRMVMGVGNKATHYSDSDVDTLSLIGNDLWRVVQRARAEAALQRRLAELEVVNQKLSEAQVQLLQSEKMASIGQLAAGVAHEINNPIGFVKSNLGTLSGYVQELLALVNTYGDIEKQLGGAQASLFESVRLRKGSSDFAFMATDLPQLIDESREGISRVSKIVLDLKNFSRSGDNDWSWADLQAGIESTINVVWNQFKYKAEVIRDYAELPMVYCVASQINQVVMNLLVNAGQAIAERGTLTVRTGVAGDQVWIEVQDTGCGIAPNKQAHVFEPFYTTKAIGMGTGLGLSIAADIISRHHGKILLQSAVGVGSTFRIQLPINATQVPPESGHTQENQP